MFRAAALFYLAGSTFALAVLARSAGILVSDWIGSVLDGLILAGAAGMLAAGVLALFSLRRFDRPLD